MEKKTTIDEEVEEGNSRQGFATNRDGRTKARKRLSQISEDKLKDDNWDVPGSVNTMGLTKEKKFVMFPGQNVRRDARLPVSISGVSINNYGSGIVVNRDVGNIQDSTISNVGNNNSENYFHPRPKPTYATKEKKPTMTPRQNVRWETAPAPVSTSGSIINYGSARNDVGDIKNSIISNVGNNNSKNNYQFMPKTTYATNLKEKKPDLTPRYWHDLRQETAPAPVSTSGVSINDYGSGSGTVASSDVEHIKNSEHSRKPHTHVLIVIN